MQQEPYKPERAWITMHFEDGKPHIRPALTAGGMIQRTTMRSPRAGRLVSLELTLRDRDLGVGSLTSRLYPSENMGRGDTYTFGGLEAYS